MTKFAAAFSHLTKLVRLQALPPADPEVVQNQPLPMVGLFAGLTEEQKAKALNVEENVNFGQKEFLMNSQSRT